MQPLVVVLLTFENFHLLDVTGPASVFASANTVLGRIAYDVRLVSGCAGMITSGAGLALPASAVDHSPPTQVHTLLIAGDGRPAVSADPTLRRWLEEITRLCPRFGSASSGVLVLAEIGALKGHHVAAHWTFSEELARQLPDVHVNRDSLFVQDGRVWTSAGATSAIDMALSMVESDFGQSIANEIAKMLILYVRRPGYQSQFSPLLQAQCSVGSPFAELIEWMSDRLNQRLDVPSLAEQTRLSLRTFHRRFCAAIGQTPAQFVETLRVDAARSLLATGLPLKTIANRIGFRSPARLTMAFERRFGVSPVPLPATHCSRARALASMLGVENLVAVGGRAAHGPRSPSDLRAKHQTQTERCGSGVGEGEIEGGSRARIANGCTSVVAGLSRTLPPSTREERDQ